MKHDRSLLEQRNDPFKALVPLLILNVYVGLLHTVLYDALMM